MTHGVHRLSYADHIIALDTGGRITEQGTFERLMHNGGYVRKLAANHKSEEDVVVDEQTPDLTSISKNASVDGSKEQASKELSRQVGDITVYKYYFASMGWFSTVFFLILISSFAFFIRFPGMPSLNSRGIC